MINRQQVIVLLPHVTVTIVPTANNKVSYFREKPKEMLKNLLTYLSQRREKANKVFAPPLVFGTFSTENKLHTNERKILYDCK